jgi:hypothetical protein
LDAPPVPYPPDTPPPAPLRYVAPSRRLPPLLHTWSARHPPGPDPPPLSPPHLPPDPSPSPSFLAPARPRRSRLKLAPVPSFSPFPPSARHHHHVAPARVPRLPPTPPPSLPRLAPPSPTVPPPRRPSVLPRPPPRPHRAGCPLVRENEEPVEDVEQVQGTQDLKALPLLPRHLLELADVVLGGAGRGGRRRLEDMRTCGWGPGPSGGT